MRGKTANDQTKRPNKSESMINLFELKKQTENLPSLRKSLSKVGAISQRDDKTKGKLKLGVINKATMVLNR